MSAMSRSTDYDWTQSYLERMFDVDVYDVADFIDNRNDSNMTWDQCVAMAESVVADLNHIIDTHDFTQ